MHQFSQSRRFVVLVASLLVLRPATPVAQSTNPIQIPSGSFRIAGTAVSATTGHPLARARVFITDTANRQGIQSVLSSEDGHFEFQVPAGKFALQAAKRGFITGSYNQHDQFSTAIVTGAGLDTETLVLRIAPSAVLFGKVFDEAGDPVRHARITVYREDHQSGVSHIRPFRNADTDDQGSYEVTPLDGGTYFVSAGATPWYALHPPSNQPGPALSSLVDRSLDVAYPITYYADVTEADEATPIPVRGGDHVEVDLHLNPVPALHLLFHTPGNAENGFGMPELQKPAFDGMESLPQQGFAMVSPGVFEIVGIPAGRYTVSTRGPANGQVQEQSQVDLTGDSQELDVSSGELSARVKATVAVLGGDSLPPQLTVALRNGKGRIASRAEVDAKGTVEFPSVSPGKYDVLAGSPAKAYSVARIASQGSETSGHSLNVPSGASVSVSLSLVGGAVRVEGVARRTGKAAPGVMVVLVPHDPEQNRELFRRDQSDLDGSFSLQSVIPGSYTIIAIADAWEMDWAKPAVIAHYCQRGQTVKVVGQSNQSMRLPEPVEVQTR
jgi:protocatechuate 3,4-dioxygenase beta subunit